MRPPRAASFLQRCLSVCFQCLHTSAVGLPNPVAAVGAHDAHKLIPNQFVFVWALQRDDCAHTGAIALDDLLGAQGWQGHGFALSPGLTCKQKSGEKKKRKKKCHSRCAKTVHFQRSDHLRVFKFVKTTESRSEKLREGRVRPRPQVLHSNAVCQLCHRR